MSGEVGADRAHTSSDGTPSEPPLLRLDGLRKVFSDDGPLGGSGDEVVAVADVSCRIAAGETLALVGESGCGKTTTARLALGLEAPTSGSVRFRGRALHEMSRDERRTFRRRVQIVFQDPFGSLNPRLTVGQALREPLRVHRVAPGREDERVAELLETVGLEAGDAQRYPHEFSGGQRQRIGLARALSVEPDLLVADEPVSALDVSVQAQILELLDDLRDRLGLTVLLIAHDLAVVRRVADRVAVMYLGRIVESGPVDDLFEEPLHPYTRSLLEAVPRPRPEGAPRDRRGREPATADPPPDGCPFHPRCAHPDRDMDACLDGVPPLEEKRPGGSARCVKVSGSGAGSAALGRGRGSSPNLTAGESAE